MVATIFLIELRKVSSLWQRTLFSFKEAPLSISTGSMNGLGALINFVGVFIFRRPNESVYKCHLYMKLWFVGSVKKYAENMKKKLWELLRYFFDSFVYSA